MAVDTEAMGLDPRRDRLCLVQLCGEDGRVHAVKFEPGPLRAPNLARLLEDGSVEKLFHFARFDLAMIRWHLGAACRPVYCTKIASRLARTFSGEHGLKDLCREVLGENLSKERQSSDWGAPELDRGQLEYAAADVVHLHALRARLDDMLEREGRAGLAAACFGFLPHRVELDLAGWRDSDLFAH